MTDDADASPERPAKPARPRPPGPRSRSSLPQHRRRRAVALFGALVVVILLTVVLSSGGGGHTPSALAPTGTTGGQSDALGPGLLAEIKVLAGSGRGSIVADDEQAENSAITRTLAYTPYVRIAGSQHKEVALTFDDGPGPYTPQVLDVLERMHTPGTFFEVGIEEQYFHDSTSRIVSDGFPIGDHTESHAPMGHLPKSEQLTQLIDQTHAIARYGAPFPRLFRPPYGLWNDTTLSLLKKYRMLMVLWTVDTEDYREPGTTAIVDSALDGARPGAIILLHDAGGNRTETVAALPLIINGLRKRGYKLVTVPRLLLDNPAPKDQNIVGLTGLGGG